MSLKARIEAVLFITAQALEVKDIAEILKEEEDVIEESLLELIMDYSAREGALEIDDENGYILQVKQDYMGHCRAALPCRIEAFCFENAYNNCIERAYQAVLFKRIALKCLRTCTRAFKNGACIAPQRQKRPFFQP